MSGPELKPCPFCGNDGNGPIEEALHIIFMEFTEPFRKGSAWSVQCDKCTATMGYFDSEDEAVAAWNTRAPVTVQDAARVVEIKALIEAAKLHQDQWKSYRETDEEFAVDRKLAAALRAITGEAK